MSDPVFQNDPRRIVAWRRIDHRLTSSGQPDEAGLAAIHALGAGHVVNLGLHDHPKALPDEAASVAAQGMRYIHIPVDFARPVEADYTRFRDVMHALADRPLHVHCIANLRVSAFLYRYRRDELHVPEPLARADMDALWRPGEAWARLIGREEDAARDHLYPGRDY